MISAEPSPTQYDLRFQLGGVPVRVHPFFWLAAIFLGASSNDGPGLLIWTGVVFASILVHELGHCVAMRRFGQSPRIVLYMLGGLAISDSSPYPLGFGSGGRSARSQIIISAAGPAAGFLLAGLVAALVHAAGGRVSLERDFPEFWTVELGDALKENGRLKVLINDLLWVNIFWGLINLLPLFPLDGGHIAREILVSQDPQNGWIRSLWVSVFTGGALVVFALWRRDWYMGILFGMLAYTSYAAIQQYTGRGGFGGGRPW